MFKKELTLIGLIMVTGLTIGITLGAQDFKYAYKVTCNTSEDNLQSDDVCKIISKTSGETLFTVTSEEVKQNNLLNEKILNTWLYTTKG